MNATTANRPMRADARRNRERILVAARELFASSSPDVQIDDVARLAGVASAPCTDTSPTSTP